MNCSENIHLKIAQVIVVSRVKIKRENAITFLDITILFKRYIIISFETYCSVIHQ